MENYRGKSDVKSCCKKPVILNLIQDLQRELLLFVNGVRGRSRIKYGMTSLFNNGGFTLIELLVVVLIIGILAAVAVPQYQKAVRRAKYARMLPLMNAIVRAQQLYFLANGTYATSFDQLGVITSTNTRGCPKWIETDRRNVEGICVGLVNLPYTPAIRVDLPTQMDIWDGYGYWFRNYNSKVTAQRIFCMEGRNANSPQHCTGTLLYSDATGKFYTME